MSLLVVAMHRVLPQLTLSDLRSPSLREALRRDLSIDYYWSDDFSPQFYAEQARAGMIAITERLQEKEILLCEMQRSYALLSPAQIHVGRHVRRLLRRDQPTLHVGMQLETVQSLLDRYHRDNWLTPRYVRILRALNQTSSGVIAVSVLVRHNAHIISGEMGYIIGSTYTSLSGFSSRQKRYRHYGKVQLVLLGRWLEQRGLHLWNLGQPYMPYKFELGAREYVRSDFLRLWDRAIASNLPG